MAALLIEELSKSMELPEDVKHCIAGCCMIVILHDTENEKSVFEINL